MLFWVYIFSMLSVNKKEDEKKHVNFLVTSLLYNQLIEYGRNNGFMSPADTIRYAIRNLIDNPNQANSNNSRRVKPADFPPGGCQPAGR
jgi:hypothetical protein